MGVSNTATQLLAWLCIVAVAVLSLTPAEQMTRTGWSGHIEHVVAYAGTAFVTAMAFPKRGVFQTTLALVIYAGSLEFLQRFSPGRTSSICDFVFSGVGVVVGACAFALLQASRTKLQRHKPSVPDL